MGPGFVVLIWVGIALVGITIFVLAMIAEKKRKEGIQKLATELGLEYHESLSVEDNGIFGNFELAGKGRSKKSSNVIVADSGETRMVIFDYQFTTGSGKNSSTHRQTVVLTQSLSLQVPVFSMGPENFFHRLGEFLGMDDIDFDDSPEFSNRFLLRGPDESAVREFFNQNRRKDFLQFQNVSVEGQGDRFIFFQQSQRRDVDKIKELMEQAFKIYQLLS